MVVRVEKANAVASRPAAAGDGDVVLKDFREDEAPEDRLRLDSHSSEDSGFDGLENLEPLDLDDVQKYPSDTK